MICASIDTCEDELGLGGSLPPPHEEDHVTLTTTRRYVTAGIL